MAARVQRIKGRMYDTGTANKSFLQVAKDLKTVEVKEWYFMLEIYDVSLINVNPFSVNESGTCNLTQDQVSRIITECTRNPWYYLREICRIPDPGNANGVSYKANRGNIAQAWCIYHGLDSWLCLTRQQGKTQSALAMQAWAYIFGTSNTTFIFLNIDGTKSKENLRRLGDQIDLLPSFLKFKSILTEEGSVIKETRNATEMRHPINKNKIQIKSKATSYDSAMSIARGLSAAILYFDEPEFTSFIDTIVSNSVSTYNTTAQRSKENGTIHARIFTCTPGDLDTETGQQSQKILDKTITWDDSFYNKTIEEIEEFHTVRESNKILYIEYKYYQIGLDNAWLADIANQINDPLTVRREILLQRLHGSNNSPYDQEDLAYISETQKRIIDTVYINTYYPVDIYEPLDKQIPYIVGVDCSTGTNSDFNTVTVVNPYTLNPVAEFECSYIGETNYEAFLIALVTEHIPRAIVCIERNSVGDGIIDHLLQSKIQRNLYFDKNRDLVAEKMNGYESDNTSMLKMQASMKKFYGVYTQGKSREQMFSILARHVREYRDNFVTKNIIRDLNSLVKKSSGKIEAGSGFHDDSIMSYLMAMYVYYHGNNLEMFGFYKGSDADIGDHNSGMSLAESDAIPDNMKEGYAQSEEAAKALNYEDMLRSIYERSQRESITMAERDLVTDSYAKNTENTSYDDYGDINLSLFDSLNGF